MARRRFFVSEISGGRAIVSGDEAHHLTRVLRVEPGQKYEISDGHRVFLAEVETARRDLVAFSVLEPIVVESLPADIVLCVALIKFDRLELLIEKATELGVSSLVIFAAARSEKGLQRAAPNRLERWKRIAREASEQSRRTTLPRIEAPVPFQQVLASAARCRLLLDEATTHPLLGALPSDPRRGDRVALIIGPEGGWTDSERTLMHEANWISVSIGDTVLRTETAALAALAVINAAWSLAASS